MGALATAIVIGEQLVIDPYLLPAFGKQLRVEEMSSVIIIITRSSSVDSVIWDRAEGVVWVQVRQVLAQVLERIRDERG